MAIDPNQKFTGGCEIVFVNYKNQPVVSAHVSLEDQSLATFIEVAMTEKNIKAAKGYDIVFFDEMACKMKVKIHPNIWLCKAAIAAFLFD